MYVIKTITINALYYVLVSNRNVAECDHRSRGNWQDILNNGSINKSSALQQKRCTISKIADLFVSAVEFHTDLVGWHCPTDRF